MAHPSPGAWLLEIREISRQRPLMLFGANTFNSGLPPWAHVSLVQYDRSLSVRQNLNWLIRPLSASISLTETPFKSTSVDFTIHSRGFEPPVDVASSNDSPKRTVASLNYEDSKSS
jgi:hypothetical protein